MVFGDYLAVTALGYLLGSIPTGYLVARARGVDIRAVGSGNIGATNVLRMVGRAAGIGVLLVDAAKGAAACALLPRFFLMGAHPVVGGNAQGLAIVAGIGAILGHNFTCWLHFRGGKGIATSAGVLLVLMPLPLVLTAVAWGLTFAVSRYVSLASIAAALTLPVFVWVTDSGNLLTFVAVVLALLAIFKHRMNIRRLLNGTEHRFVRHSKAHKPDL